MPTTHSSLHGETGVPCFPGGFRSAEWVGFLFWNGIHSRFVERGVCFHMFPLIVLNILGDVTIQVSRIPNQNSTWDFRTLKISDSFYRTNASPSGAIFGFPIFWHKILAGRSDCRRCVGKVGGDSAKFRFAPWWKVESPLSVFLGLGKVRRNVLPELRSVDKRW